MISNIQKERDKHENEKKEIWKAKVWLEEQYNMQKNT